MNILKKIVNKLINILFYLCLLFVAWIIMQVFILTSFRIPSDSMEPTLIPGDNIVVNKLPGGARLFDIFASLEKKEIDIHRVPGFSSFKRNDVLVFNFPYPAQWDSIGFDVMRYYVKRCIAIPGDTLEISNGYYKVKGIDEELGNIASQKQISSFPDDFSFVVMEAYPQNKIIDWTIKNFGPMPVPAKGQEMLMDEDNWILYERLIRWEQKERVNRIDNDFYLGDSLITSYRFTENYYFLGGDKGDNSQDSRYWGLLPESFIVGRADFIFYSRHKESGKFRWDRFLKKIE